MVQVKNDLASPQALSTVSLVQQDIRPIIDEKLVDWAAPRGVISLEGEDIDQAHKVLQGQLCPRRKTSGVL